MMVGYLGRSIGYLNEILIHAKPIARGLQDLSSDPAVRAFLANRKAYTVSMAGAIGTLFYDMTGAPKGERRELVRVASAQLNLFTGIVDDIIDTKPTTLDEKFRLMEKMHSALFYSDQMGHQVDEDAAYTLARGIRNGFFSQIGRGKLENIFLRLEDGIKRQFTASSPDELREIASVVGGSCLEILAEMAVTATNERRDEVTSAARFIGAYGQLLDDLHDLDKDLWHRINTYPTVRIMDEGDSAIVRDDIRKRCREYANEALVNGLSRLKQKEQREIYKLLKLVIDLRFSFGVMDYLMSISRPKYEAKIQKDGALSMST